MPPYRPYTTGGTASAGRAEQERSRGGSRRAGSGASDLPAAAIWAKFTAPEGE